MNALSFRQLHIAFRAWRLSLCTVTALLLTFFFAPAQKVTVRDGIILRNAEPYARIRTSGALLEHHNFSFRTLDGKEFMMMHYDDAAGDYRVVFLPGEETTRLAEHYGSTTVMAQEIVDNNLVESGAFNPAGLRRFMLAHPPEASPSNARSKRAASDVSKNGESSTSETVREIDRELEQAADDVSDAILNIGDAIERAFEKDSVRRAERQLQSRQASGKSTAPRNRSALVTANGDELRQDGHLIGTYLVKKESHADTVERIYYVYSGEDGDLVAEVRMPDVKPRSAELVTPQDNKLTTVVLKSWTEKGVAAEIGTWLVKRRYL